MARTQRVPLRNNNELPQLAVSRIARRTGNRADAIDSLPCPSVSIGALGDRRQILRGVRRRRDRRLRRRDLLGALRAAGPH